MTKPAAISGSLVDAKNVAAHKCMRLSIDVPAELAKQVIDAFGWPTMADPVPVAIARLISPVAQSVEQRNLTPKAAGSTPAGAAKDPTPWRDLALSQQAAMRCQEVRFRRFLAETGDYQGIAVLDLDMAAEDVRERCGVTSRADILPNTPAGRIWADLDSKFQAWVAAG